MPNDSAKIILAVTNGKLSSDPDYEAYEGVEVKTAGLKKKTDATGKAVFDLQNGDYGYAVSGDGFITEKGKYTVNSGAAAVAVTLREK